VTGEMVILNAVLGSIAVSIYLAAYHLGRIARALEKP
jgi:hypothetical protein